VNETETRAEHIDPALKAAAWGVVEGSRVRREYLISPGRIESHGRRARATKADYILEYRNTKLAMVEAKAWDQPLTGGLAQAKDYAAKLQHRFAYCTNGQAIYGVGMQTGREDAGLTAFPTPDELWDLTFSETNAWRDWFVEVPFEDRSGTWATATSVILPLSGCSTRLRMDANASSSRSRRNGQDDDRVPDPNVRNIVLMRPVNSMIEFKQIIGRGTRLFEGKDYFTPRIREGVRALQRS
jgi:type I site-specific restriction endonuclease